MIPTPRSDELNALEALINQLKVQGVTESPKVVYEPNGVKTAPDYLLVFPSYSVLLEIRNSGGGFLVLSVGSEYRLVPKERYELSAIGMLKKIENIVITWLDQSETILLTITAPIPIEQRGCLAKKIAKQLEDAYRSKSWYLNQSISFQVSTKDANLPSLPIEAKLTNYYAGRNEYSPVKDILAASLQSPAPTLQCSLSEQAYYTLSTALEEKSKKLAHLNGEKWLVVINTNSLLDHYLYSEAYTRILQQKDSSPPIFFKVFIVEGKIAKELIANKSKELNKSC